MKRFQPLISFFLIIGLVYLSFSSLMPKSGTPASISETKFSTERALIPLREITKAPHYIGTEEHARVREYIVEQLNGLGLETEIQEGFIMRTPRGREVTELAYKHLGRIKQGTQSGLF